MAEKKINDRGAGWCGLESPLKVAGRFRPTFLFPSLFLLVCAGVETKEEKQERERNFVLW